MNVPSQTPIPFTPLQASAPPIEVILPDGTSAVPMGSGVITSVLGEGGAALVYEIWNEQFGVKRAVKLLRPNAMPTTFERFSTEVRITAQLRHPNIIEVHTVGEWNKLPYIEMERLDGCSLDKLIASRGAIPVRVALAVGIMVCRALAYTHNHSYTVNGKEVKGVLHRDLKPPNIMIADNGIVKLMDFGLATPVDTSMHTMEGTFVGSLQYLAPEQLDGKKASTSSDLYAFGAVMYEMLTGRQAFSETNMTKFVAARMRNAFRPLRDYHLSIPVRLIRLINSCMAFDREKRAQDAGMICREIEHIYGSLCKVHPEETVAQYLHTAGSRRTVRTRHKSLIVPFAIAVAVTGGILSIVYLGWTYRDALPQLFLKPARDTVQVQSVAAVAETVFVPTAAPQPEPAAAVIQPVKASPNRTATTRGDAAPIRTDAPAPAPNQSFIAELIKKHGTADLQAIMDREARVKGHANVLRVYDSLPEAQKKSKQAVLCRMRALESIGNRPGLSAFADLNPLDDAEYFLIRARNAYDLNRYSDALMFVTNSQKSTAEFADANEISREALYYRAQSLSAQFKIAATESTRSAAINAWFDVKYAFRSEQNHRYFVAANEQIRLMNRGQEGDN